MRAAQVAFLDRCAGIRGAEIRTGAFRPDPAVWVGPREVAHFDGPTTLDIRLTKQAIRSRRAELKADARVTLRASGSEWLEFEMRTTADTDRAFELVSDAARNNRISR